MKFRKTYTLKNGKTLTLVSADASFAADLIEIRRKTSAETDNMLRYPDEICDSTEEEEEFLSSLDASGTGIEICAVADGKVVGCAGITAAGGADKLLHRAEFGVCVERDYWHLGIGTLLTEACIFCARETGYVQIELDVVSANERAVNLYRRLGFSEYGRNPKGFRLRDGSYQELVLMRLELDG